MAWRDSRSQRRRILLYLSSITVGVAALVAIRSFGLNVSDAVDVQAKSLLGADLVVRSRRVFPDEVTKLLDTIPGESSRQSAFVTMAFFPKSSMPRLVQIRASEPGFPWYGDVLTVPRSAYLDFRKAGSVLVDETLMIQFGAKAGEVVKIGQREFRIAGALKQLPGENFVISQLAPRVIMPMQELKTTGLMGFGSRVAYQRSFKLPVDYDIAELVKTLDSMREKHGISYDTVDSRSRRLGNRLSNLFSYLGLVGFVALLLGGVGVASSIHVYVKGKMGSVATLRCVGCTAASTFGIYLAQAIVIGLIGGLAGVGLGLLVQFLLPSVLGEYIPVNLELSISWSSVAVGLLTGLSATFLFALLPMLRVRRVSPLMTLRLDLEPNDSRDPAKWGLYLIIQLAMTGYAVLTAPRWQDGLAFSIALLVSLLLLAGLASLLMLLVRRLFPKSFPFVLRQGLNNLYRPRNQTRTLVLCLGVGVFLIMSQYLSNRQLVKQIERSEEGKNPNMVLFDIQDSQLDEVRGILRDMDLPVMDEVPIVSMRIESINGKSVEELRKVRRQQREKGGMGRRRGRGQWVYNREYRSTYRSKLNSSEELIEGKLTADVKEGEVAPVSLERDIAMRLGAKVGDEIVFDVQGIPVRTVVGSIRKVDWYKMQPNFFVVFPRGVLEDAPKMTVMVTKVPTPEMSSVLQVRVVKTFPNVALIDLSQVVDTFSNILDKMSFAVRFMALFSIATGVLVLVSSVSNSRHQRARESVLLRTLGASRKQIIGIMMTEYVMLGALAANAGIVLAVVGSWAMCRFMFEVSYDLDVGVLLAANGVVLGITLGVGLLNSIGSTRRPPLEVLRETET